MPHFAAELGLYCLPMAHKKDARLMWVKALCNALPLINNNHHTNEDSYFMLY